MGFKLNLKIYVYILVVVAAVAIGRLAYVSLLPRGSTTSGSASKQALRLPIFDRHGNLLARSLEAYNVYLNPQKKGAKEAMAFLATLLEVDAERLQTSRKVTLVRRFVSATAASRIAASRNEAILLERVYQRFYPNHEVLSQSLGFVGFEGRGLTGLEKGYEDFLSRSASFEEPADPRAGLYLTFDLNLQRKVEHLLERAIEEHEADSGSVLIQEIATGKVRVLANLPQFDLNAFHTYEPHLFNNAALSKNIEPGSIFKAFFIAYLLESKQINPSEKRYTSRGVYVLSNGEYIRDIRGYGAVSLQDIVRHSINGGIVEACAGLSQKSMYNYLSRFQFDRRLVHDFPGGARAILPPRSKKWGVRTKATIPMGHGIAMSPIRIINAFSALVSDGLLKRPMFVEQKVSYSPSKQVDLEAPPFEVLGIVLGQATAIELRKVLSHGTSRGSTGHLANSTGYKSIGKTGTSQMVNFEQGGYYTNKYHSLFVGAYPADKPLVSMLVILNNPKKQHSGGRIAAPLYAKILPEAIHNLQLPDPKKPLKKLPNKPMQKPSVAQSEFIKPNSIKETNTNLALVELDDLDKISRQESHEQPPSAPKESENPQTNTVDKGLPSEGGSAVGEAGGVGPNDADAETNEETKNLPRVIPNKMPDFTTLSLREAMTLLQKIRNTNPKIQLRHSTTGSGYVYKQSIRPGKTLKEGKKVHLKLYFRDGDS